jgi:hypothetical protein
MASYSNESKDIKISDSGPSSEDIGVAHAHELKAGDDRYEVFKKGDGQVDFRTVSWIRASAIFLKSAYLQQINRRVHRRRL